MKIGKLEITIEECRKLPKVFPFKKFFLSLFLVTMILFFLPRFVFPVFLVNLIGDKFFVFTLLIGLLCGVFLIVSVISDVIKWSIHRIQYSGKYACRKIKKLSPYSQAIVRVMIDTDTRSRKLSIISATWAELNRNNIISYAEYGIKNKNEIDCYLNYWVVDCLKNNPDFFDLLPTIDNEDMPF